MAQPLAQCELWNSMDPVCGMEVSEESEFRFHYDGIKYYFCSDHCEKKFAVDPARYLRDEGKGQKTGHDHEESCHVYHADSVVKKTAQLSVSNVVYTCPMHPEIQEEHPGSCPKCGMALEPVAEPVGATRTEYTCPMHPEIVQDNPGDCPKCGLALEPRVVEIEDKKTRTY